MCIIRTLLARNDVHFKLQGKKMEESVEKSELLWDGLCTGTFHIHDLS